jgi:hypothetical protein
VEWRKSNGLAVKGSARRRICHGPMYNFNCRLRSLTILLRKIYPPRHRFPDINPDAMFVQQWGLMLVPEQSADALIAHHPPAKYFDVK